MDVTRSTLDWSNHLYHCSGDSMKRLILTAITMACATTAIPSHADTCSLTPKEVVTRFMNEFYTEKKVREAFESWVVPGYIQHNPMAPNGRDAAIQFLEPFFAQNSGIRYSIKRIIADGNLVVVHSHGKFSVEDRGMAIVDILRVEGCKVVEHWDVLQPVPEKSANDNTMF
jgi:predicted SnoaL-like aldol condensation-catalyzing enzyme